MLEPKTTCHHCRKHIHTKEQIYPSPEGIKCTDCHTLTTPLTEIEIAELIQPIGMPIRRLAYERDTLKAKITELKEKQTNKEPFFVKLKSELNYGIKFDLSTSTLDEELIYVVRLNTNDGKFYQGLDPKLENAIHQAIKQYKEQ